MVVYLDVLFLLNFCIDFLCLYAAGKICRRKLSAPRLAGAGGIGGLYAAVICAFPPGFDVLKIILHIACAALLCLTAYSFTSRKAFLKVLFTFFCAAASLGGMMYALCAGMGKISYFDGVFYTQINAPAVILISAVMTGAVTMFLTITKKTADVKTAKVTVESDGKSFTVDSLIDSGNLLTDPISLDSVILIKSASMESFMRGRRTDELRGFRLIPCERGLIAAFRPDKISVKPFGALQSSEVRAVVGIDNKNGSFGGYDALLPGNLI